ncbi:STY4528 family pathogenicity island replication protein [Chitinimonas lacunae]|uniref:STY4528 family pathogenicity island replication protein n=1 Tax=Chitinimonas lacunae TaxID=1963018 RepID=A0ABV8MV76_9NEIS
MTARQLPRGDAVPRAQPDPGQPPTHPTPPTDLLLFSGNRHESVPRALFFDRRLTPLERNAWQVFRLQVRDDGPAVLPTYEALRPFLAAMPGALASTETVARTLTLLRLTRWLSLVRRRRDPRTGRVLGNLYVLHDAPLSPYEAIQLDPEYLSLVSDALTHASRAIQVTGQHVLQEIDQDPALAGRTLPTRLQLLAQRIDAQRSGLAPDLPTDVRTSESEVPSATRLRNQEAPTSESEIGAKPLKIDSLRNPKSDSTVRSSFSSKKRTARASQDWLMASHLALPPRFLTLKEEQQAGAITALLRVDTALQQGVLDEWDLRCGATTVRNPAGYLFGIIQKAMRGEFKACAKPSAPARSALPETPAAPARPPSDPELVREHIARLRDLLQLR